VIPIEERIMRRVVKDENGCWNWQGAKIYEYGTIRIGPKNQGCKRTHRAMYEVMVGPIPEGMELDHLCFNPACCNPAHLEPVTRLVNMQRSHAHRKSMSDEKSPV
jgi:hypothetical protein